MPPSASHLDYIKDLLSPFGEITTRRMFGGAGVYCDGMIFAIIGEDDLWFKVDDATRAEFEDAGLAPFEVEMNGKKGTMSYYNAPEEIFDDHDALARWMTLALAAARRGYKPKKKTKSKSRSSPRKRGSR